MTFEAIDSPRSDEILEAALCCFADKGFGPTRVEDIARKAGLSKGAVYLYFKSKEDMLQAAVQRSVGLMVRAANQLTLTAGSKNPEKALRVFHKMVMQSLSDPDLSAAPRIVLAEAARFPELAQFYRDEVIEVGRKTLDRLLEAGHDQGAFRDIDLDAFVRLLIGPGILHMTMVTTFTRPGEVHPDTDTLSEQLFDLIWLGLKPRCEP